MVNLLHGFELRNHISVPIAGHASAVLAVDVLVADEGAHVVVHVVFEMLLEGGEVHEQGHMNGGHGAGVCA